MSLITWLLLRFSDTRAPVGRDGNSATLHLPAPASRLGRGEGIGVPRLSSQSVLVLAGRLQLGSVPPTACWASRSAHFVDVFRWPNVRRVIYLCTTVRFIFADKVIL